MTPSPASDETLATLLREVSGTALNAQGDRRGNIVLLVIDRESQGVLAEIRDLLKAIVFKIELLG